MAISGGKLGVFSSFIVLILIGYFSGKVIVENTSGTSLGRLIGSSLPVLISLFLLGILQVVDFRSVFLPRFSLRNRLTLTRVIGFVIAYLVLAYLLIQLLDANLPLTYWLVGILIMCGASMCLVSVATGKGEIRGFLYFLLVLPFLNYIEFAFRGSLADGTKLGPVPYSPTIIFLWVFFALLSFRRFITKQYFLHTSLDKYFLMFGLLLFLSTLASKDFLTSVHDYILNILVFPLFFVIVVNIVKRLEDVIRVMIALICYAVLRLSIAYYFILISDIPNKLIISQYFNYTDRVIEHHYILAVISLFALPIAMALFILANKKPQKILALFTIGLLFFFILIAQERSAILASGVAVSFLIFLFRRYMGSMVLLFIVFTIFMVLAGGPLIKRFTDENIYTIVNVSMRMDAWWASIRMIVDHPFLGIGLGMWREYIPFYTENIFLRSHLVTYITYPHHFWFHYGSAGGIGVLLSLILLMRSIFKDALFLVSKNLSQEVRVISGGLLCSFLSFLIYGIIGGNASAFTFIAGDHWQTVTTNAVYVGMFFWIVSGLIVSLCMLFKKTDEHR